MENREVVEWFKNRIAVMPESETKEMFRMAISALKKQEVDKCCETCKHKHLDVDASPCCDCIRAKDHYIPYTGELDIIPSVDGVGIPTDTEDFRVQFLGTVLKVGSADVVQVCRCKDCENWQTDWNPTTFPDRHYCAVMDYMMKAEDYCSYGERREE